MPTGERLQRGFTYLAVLVAVALSAAVLAAIGQRAGLAAERERERELLFRGGEIRRAVLAYQAAEPRGQLPRRLEELVTDRRGGSPRHHLRRLYADPFTGRADWVLITLADGGIVGVHSRASQMRLLLAAGPPAAGDKVSDWEFRVPAVPAQAAPATAVTKP
jgi:type II secretory pathway pseudopilin PulG